MKKKLIVELEVEAVCVGCEFFKFDSDKCTTGSCLRGHFDNKNEDEVINNLFCKNGEDWKMSDSELKDRMTSYRDQKAKVVEYCE